MPTHVKALTPSALLSWPLYKGLNFFGVLLGPKDDCYSVSIINNSPAFHNLLILLAHPHTVLRLPYITLAFSWQTLRFMQVVVSSSNIGRIYTGRTVVTQCCSNQWQFIYMTIIEPDTSQARASMGQAEAWSIEGSGNCKALHMEIKDSCMLAQPSLTAAVAAEAVAAQRALWISPRNTFTKAAALSGGAIDLWLQRWGSTRLAYFSKEKQVNYAVLLISAVIISHLIAMILSRIW